MKGNSSDYPPGFQINKAYEVIGIIGHGGMGAVYRVRHLFLSKEMALKVLPADKVSEISWKRFQIEAQAIARLTHPNIVRIFDMGMVDGVTPYYAMELLNGQSLAQKLKKKHVLPVGEAIAIYRQVCAGLAYAHEHQIIHRDIKPANIVLQEVEPGVISAKLVDFGIAKLTGDGDGDKQGLTRPGEVFGSPQYMSPEQCAGQPVDYRTDLYSLGASLFETLTGKVPFLGADAMTTVQMHQTDTPPSLYDASEGADFPEKIQELIDSLLAKDPEDRPQSASDVAAELLSIERLLANQENNEKRRESPVGVRKPTSKRNVDDSDTGSQSSAKKNSLIVASIAGVVVLCLLGGGAYFVISQNLFNRSAAEQKKEEKKVEESEQLKTEAAFKSESEKKEPFFLGTTNKDGHQVSHYKFPDEISLGTLTLRSDDDEKEQDVKGELFIPTRYNLLFTPNNLCLKNPNILRRFDDGTLQGIDLTTDEADLSNSIAPSNSTGSATKEPNLAEEGSRSLHRNDMVNNETLKCLTQIKSLKTIELTQSNVTGEVLVTLSRFPKLVDLQVGFTEIDGEQLAQSGLLASLQTLHADRCSKMSAAIAALENSARLRKLFIPFCNVSAKDIQNISTMKELTRLKLSDNALNDSDLAPLVKLSKLNDLELDGCKITPACIKTLSQCKALKEISVRRNGWTAEQIESFKAEMKKTNPQITIKIDLAEVPTLKQLAEPAPAEE
ncbi:protein kinase [bacterium]|nr:protein kinase [bacterium]MBP9810924.1 protein kinase [bacterium]